MRFFRKNYVTILSRYFVLFDIEVPIFNGRNLSDLDHENDICLLYVRSIYIYIFFNKCSFNFVFAKL